MSDHHTIDTLLDETRTFPPPSAFAASANANDGAIYRREVLEYWESWAKTLDWVEPWHTTLEWNCPTRSGL